MNDQMHVSLLLEITEIQKSFGLITFLMSNFVRILLFFFFKILRRNWKELFLLYTLQIYKRIRHKNCGKHNKVGEYYVVYI
jgi:hypothetical protein